MGFLSNGTWLGTRWAEHFRTYTAGRVPRNARVLIRDGDIHFFRDLFGQRTKFDGTTLQAYIVCRTLTSLVGKIREGTRVTLCWHQTLHAFDFATSSDVLFRTVNQSRMEGVTETMRSISEEVRRSFGECEWMDDATRRAAQKKLDLRYAY